jgi:hypothetical protein
MTQGADFRGVNYPLTIPRGTDGSILLTVTEGGVARSMASATSTPTSRNPLTTQEAHRG